MMSWFRLFCFTAVILSSCYGDFQDDVDMVDTILDELQAQADKILQDTESLRKEYSALRYKYGGTANNINKKINEVRHKNHQLFENVRKDLFERQRNPNLIMKGIPEITNQIVAPRKEEIESHITNFETDRDKKLSETRTNYETFEKNTEEYLTINRNFKTLPERASQNLRGNDKFKVVDNSIYLTMRQLRSQMFNLEEQQRSDGNSGLKQIGVTEVAGDVYKINSYTGGKSFSTMHDHANTYDVIGLGKFDAVLNGIEFQTRHNDFKLFQAVKNSDIYHDVEPIEMPELPGNFDKTASVAEQIAVMKKLFEDFKGTDDTSQYKKTFKPVLCYLEGAYEKVNEDDKIEKPLFPSSHKMDATTYKDLFEKVFYASFTGEQNEDWAYLPRTIMDFDDQQNIIVGQWNYRILCNPITADFKRKYLELIPDSLSEINVPGGANIEDSLQARYTLDAYDVNGVRKARPVFYTKLDEVMEECVGKSNGKWVKAEGFDSKIVSANPNKDDTKEMNGGKYHRAYKLKQKDAMGVDSAQRSFADRIYVAFTKHQRILPVSYTDKDDRKVTARVSFAVPLEIIYETVLAKWNPYGITIKETGQVNKGTADDPYTFITKDDSFYMTPCEFFENDQDKRYVKVGNEKFEVCASGMRALLPVKGVGKVRLRYPIFPVSVEGGTIGKNINAMEDILRERPAKVVVKPYSTGVSTNQEVHFHTHVAEIPIDKFRELEAGQEIKMVTSAAADHQHTLTLKMTDGIIEIVKCDEGSNDEAGVTYCFDYHPPQLRTSKLPA